LASKEISGIDVSTAYQYRKVRLAVDHTHIFWYKQESVPGLGMRNRLGEAGLPPWRNTVALSYFPGERHDLTVFANTIAGQQKETHEGRLENYTTVNAQYSFKTKSFGTFTVGVNNLFDTTPPLDDTVPTDPFDVTLYDQILRSYYTGYKATF
jgi:outer membrane receptor protein involved in Fe transport